MTRGRAWMRRELAEETDAGSVERHVLSWPPTKITGRYPSPYVADLDEAGEIGRDAHPSGAPAELDLEREVSAAADALRRT